MLINTWYVAAEAADIKDKPVRVKMLGQHFAIFRGEDGEIRCVSDVCIHRGGSLSGGKVKKNCIECPYHGWQFNGNDGKCEQIPAAGPDASIPKKARVDSYPVQVKFGWVWVFVGDLPEEERPPLPEFAEYEDTENWRCIRGEFKWEANYARVCENALDPAHAAFIHGDVFGNPDDPSIHPFEVDKDEWTGGATFFLTRPPIKGIWKWVKGNAKRPAVEVRNEYHMSGMTVLLRQNISSWMRLALFDVNTPVDENHTHTRWILARTFFRGPMACFFMRADADSKRRTLKIFEQDRVVVEDIKPILVPEFEDELSIRSDALQIAFRKRRQDYQNRGWAIDLEADEAKAGERRALSLPSPNRKTVPANEWIIDTVPRTESRLRPRLVVPEQKKSV